MKSEQLIKDTRLLLQGILAAPCGCAPGQHECQAGAAVVKGIIDCLAWVLDEPSNFQQAVKGAVEIANENIKKAGEKRHA